MIPAGSRAPVALRRAEQRPVRRWYRRPSRRASYPGWRSLCARLWFALWRAQWVAARAARRHVTPSFLQCCGRARSEPVRGKYAWIASGKKDTTGTSVGFVNLFVVLHSGYWMKLLPENFSAGGLHVLRILNVVSGRPSAFLWRRVASAARGAWVSAAIRALITVATAVGCARLAGRPAPVASATPVRLVPTRAARHRRGAPNLIDSLVEEDARGQRTAAPERLACSVDTFTRLARRSAAGCKVRCVPLGRRSPPQHEPALP